MKPGELNKTTDDTLFAAIDASLGLQDPGAPEEPPPLANFITLELLRRVHERLLELNNAGRFQMAKQKAFTRAVCTLTGVGIPPDERDTEKIGNHLEVWLKRKYVDVCKKLRRNVKNVTNREQLLASVREECCAIGKWGGVEVFVGPFDDADVDPPLKRRAPHVPFTRSSSPSDMSLLELREEVSKARREASEAEANYKKEATRCEVERGRCDDMRKRVRSAEADAASARELANSVKKEKLEVERQARTELQRVERESQRALNVERGKVLRLGSQVAAATQEAAIHAHREAEAKERARTLLQRAESELELEEAKAAALRADIEQRERSAEKTLSDARARVLRLGSQVAAAAQEAAIHARKEAMALQQLELERERAQEEVALREREAKEHRSECRRLKRESQQLVTDARAEVHRLGSKVTSSARDAAMHAQEAARLKEAEADRLHDLQELEREREYYKEKVQSETEARVQCARQRDYANSMRDSVMETSKKRLLAKKTALESVSELRAMVDTLHEELEDERSVRDANAGAAEKLAMMPTWRHVRKKGKRGGGMQLQHQHRLAILEAHANGSPPSAIGRNIISVVRKAAPWLEPVEPTPREIRQIGFELPTLEEALAARRVASAYRLRLMGFDETTDNQDPVITSNVQVQDREDSNLEDLVLKGAYLSTTGATSEAVASEIEEKCFARLRELLRLWERYHQKMFPNVAWTGPEPGRCALYRLAGGGAVMSDTCNAARKTKRLVRDLIQKDAEAVLRKEIGDEAWDGMAEELREEKLRVHLLDCQHHLRNIWLGHMSRTQAAHVQAELAAQLQQFSSWERMTTEYDQLLRAVYKEFHQGGRYYKGKGADFQSWMLEHHPDTFYMHIERADGGRQDLDYDAAIPIYVNRVYLVEYLHSVVYGNNHKNILEDFLYQTLMTSQYIAMSRANALIDLRISRPHRWLAGKSALLQQWSPIKMNGVLDLIDGAFQKIRDDGGALLDPNWDIFAPIAESQPLFREYRDFSYNHDVVLSPSGRVRHLHYKLALAELLDPTDETNRRTRDKTIEYLEVQAIAALEKMYDSKLAIADKLTSQDGSNSIGKQETADRDTHGCNSTNDSTAEAVFGAWKLERRRNPGISVRRSSGLAQARISKSLAYTNAVRRRKARVVPSSKTTRKKRASSMFGFFHSLPSSEQVALVEMCRAERAQQRKLDRQDWEDLNSYRCAIRKSNSQLELEALVKNFALALSFFDRHKQRGVHSVTEMQQSLQGLASSQLRLDWLREQIEMRVVGLGWIEFKTQWSSGKDENVGSVADLTLQLTEILEEEMDRELPEAAPAPIMQRKTYKQLGTPTAQAELLSDQRLSLSMEEMRAAAARERQRLEACGELDTLGDLQPKHPPQLNEDLVGRKLEIHWRYWRHAEPGERGKKKQVFLWCEGTVAEVSDGTIRKSKRSKEALPAGAVRIRWPADADFEEKETLVWSILNPSDWCKEVHLGWRWAPSELARVAEEAGSRSSA